MRSSSCSGALAAIFIACSFWHHCSSETDRACDANSESATTLPLYGEVLSKGADSVLHLFWPCDDSSDCSKPKEVKLCFADMWCGQENNATIVELRELQLKSGHITTSYRYVQLSLHKRLLLCSRAYHIRLEYSTNSAPIDDFSWKRQPKCAKNASRSAGYIRILEDQEHCNNGDRQFGRSMTEDLPEDIHRYLLDWLGAETGPLWLGPVVGAAVAFLLAFGGGLVAWALLAGRPGPGLETLGAASQVWDARDLVILDPDNLERKLLEPMGTDGQIPLQRP